MSANAIFSDPGLLALNQSCYCYPVDRKHIEAHINAGSSHADMARLLAAREHYFASTAVFIAPDDVAAIKAQIAAIENAVTSPAFKHEVYARGYHAAYDVQTETRGVFMGYDFHMTPEGPRLIEINSNAGGAFIVGAIEQAIGTGTRETENRLGQMFAQEWSLAGRTGRPKVIAIIDETPVEQYHYPDMILASEMLSGQGFEVVIADAGQLRYKNGALMFGDTAIDLVYNRLTDFSLTGPNSSALSQALAEDAVVISPNPRHHAFHADKRNLALLSNVGLTGELGLSAEDTAALSHIPKTLMVGAHNANHLWANRRQYFFKPYGGFGSRGVYKGAKLTTKVWAQIVEGGYIAQTFIPPSVRAVTRDEDKAELKFDIRAYTCGGDILLLAARVYQGQVTNLRTAGGGLAAVITLSKGCNAGL